MTNKEARLMISAAVDCWHKVADDHDGKHCNCFRDAFVRRMIEMGFDPEYAPPTGKTDAARV
jgi:hypothetical protein